MSTVETRVRPVPVREGQLPKIDPETKRYIDLQGQAWVTRKFLKNSFRVQYRQMQELFTGVPILQGQSGANHTPLLNEAQAEKILQEHGFQKKGSIPEVDRNTREFIGLEGDIWAVRTNIEKNLGLSPNKVKTVLGKTPFIEGLDARGRKTKLYSQNHVVALLQGFKETPLMDEGWFTNNKLGKELGRSNQTVKSIADKYRLDHPEWFVRRRLPRIKRIVDVYAPELVARIREDSAKVKEAPEGWMTNRSLSKLLGVTHRTMQKLTKQYRDSHPEWFGLFLKGKITEHYSPELVLELTKQAETRFNLEIPPDGWMTVSTIQRSLQEENISVVAYDTILKLKEKYKKTNPEWAHLYMEPQRRGVFEYVAPELVAIIKNELRSIGSTPQEGWQTTTKVAEMLGVDFYKIRKIADQIQTTHPEWFRDFLRPGGKYLYYSPEAIIEIGKILKEKFSGKISPEEARGELQKLVEVKS